MEELLARLGVFTSVRINRTRVLDLHDLCFILAQVQNRLKNLIQSLEPRELGPKQVLSSTYINIIYVVYQYRPVSGIMIPFRR